MRECFFFLLKSDPIVIAVLHLKLWFSLFDTIRIHIFYKFLGFCPIFTFSSFVTLSRYWKFIYQIIGVPNKAQLIILKSLKI